MKLKSNKKNLMAKPLKKLLKLVKKQGALVLPVLLLSLLCGCADRWTGTDNGGYGSNFHYSPPRSDINHP